MSRQPERLKGKVQSLPQGAGRGQHGTIQADGDNRLIYRFTMLSYSMGAKTGALNIDSRVTFERSAPGSRVATLIVVDPVSGGPDSTMSTTGQGQNRGMERSPTAMIPLKPDRLPLSTPKIISPGSTSVTIAHEAKGNIETVTSVPGSTQKSGRRQRREKQRMRGRIASLPGQDKKGGNQPAEDYPGVIEVVSFVDRSQVVSTYKWSRETQTKARSQAGREAICPVAFVSFQEGLKKGWAVNITPVSKETC